MSKWIPVNESLPPSSEYPFTEYLVWVRYKTGGGCVMIAGARSGFLLHHDDGKSERIQSFNFQWSGGDNDRMWQQATGFLGEGGYGSDDGDDQVTHWMPLPAAPLIL